MDLYRSKADTDLLRLGIGEVCRLGDGSSRLDEKVAQAVPRLITLELCVG